MWTALDLVPDGARGASYTREHATSASNAVDGKIALKGRRCLLLGNNFLAFLPLFGEVVVAFRLMAEAVSNTGVTEYCVGASMGLELHTNLIL